MKHDLPILREGAEVHRWAGLIKSALDIEAIFTNELVAEPSPGRIPCGTEPSSHEAT